MADFIGGGMPSIAAHTDPYPATTSTSSTSTSTLQPPASNPGSEDPSAGIAKEGGGVSNTAHIGSPVPEEKTTLVGSMLQSVWGPKERRAEEHDGVTAPVTAGSTSTATAPTTASESTSVASPTTTKDASIAAPLTEHEQHSGINASTANDTTTATSSAEYGQTGSSSLTTNDATTAASNSEYGQTGSSAAAANNTRDVAPTTQHEQPSGTGAAGAAGAVAGGAVAGTAAVAGATGLSKSFATPREQGEQTAASVEKSVAETGTAASQKTAEATGSTKATTTDASATKEASVEKQAEPESSKAKATDEEGNVNDDKQKKIEDHKAATRENKDAIPTAGGEKLGKAHEGESKIVPDNPKQAVDESKPGVPDKATADNTAKNTGSTPVNNAPQKSLPVVGGHKHDATESGGKPKFMDRVKAKLHLEKKDPAAS